MRIYTIGFTKKTAEQFFGLLSDHGVERLVDIRLNPGGQLAGFAKQADLPYFLHRLARCDYVHLPELAPTDDILSTYRRDHDWGTYVAAFETLMDQREVPQRLDRRMFEVQTCCLLCSEATPEQCHRRLVGDRLVRHWPDTELIHLV
jgi:uncharacterized protein (DUF488 family)